MSVVAITGSTGTLGRAVTERVQHNVRGYPVVGCSRHRKDFGDMHGVAKADVTSPIEVAAWFDKCAKRYKPLRALITCAGIAAVESIEAQSPTDFLDVLHTNVYGTWLCIQNALRVGVERIVTVGSVLGSTPLSYPDRAAYITSKAAVVGLTRALAVELAPRGIPVNCVAPGHFSLMASKAKGLLEGAQGRSPMGLVMPGEVAEVIAWLVADAPVQLTGQVITVDGSYSISGYPVARWWE